MGSKKTIVLCSSANFYEHVAEVADELEKLGFNAVIPLDARRMRKTGDYDVSKVKTWYKNPKDFHKKRFYIDDHFKEVEKSEAILVVNDVKHGIKGYIGSNVLLEIAVAYYLKKPIFIFNPVSKSSNTYEEVHGLGCQIINKNLGKIKL